jgi:adenylate cyclase
MVVILITYAFFILEADFQNSLRRDISLLVSFSVPSFALIYFYIRHNRYHPIVAYINTLLQLTVVSGAIYFDTKAYGAQYALSSMPPIAYGLVIIVTSFRLRPFMGIFAGALAASQFLAIYIWVSRSAADMSPELLAQVPSLDWEVTIMKVVVLMGLGVAGSYSARSLTNELYNFIATAQQEMRLHQSLGRYVSSQVADALRDENQQLLATGKRNVAVMFGDIRNFTQYTNSHTAEEVTALVNTFFDHADEAINSQQGVLNKFLGDGFMAIFGLFDHDEDPCVTSTRAAFEILDKANKALAEKGMSVGIAVNYGEVIAGEVGSAGRCEYTVLGNTVNIAARLEGLNRKLHSKLLVTKDFYAALPNNFVTMETKGDHNIRGIPEAIELIELTSLIESKPD